MRRLFATIGLTAIALASLAPLASADTSVYNRYETKHIYGGYESTTGHININTTIDSTSVSKSLKAEAYGGDVNITNVRYDGDNLTGSAHSSNLRIIDPVSIITVVEQTENVLSVENISLDTYSRNYFSGSERIHEVGNTTR